MNDVIYTPIYRGTTYQYHECSECKYQVRMREDTWAPMYFGETFKFCPNCGKAVIRFANLPKFVEEFNYAVFDKIDALYKDFQDKLDYYCRVMLTKEEFDELISRCKFAVKLNKEGGAWVSPAVKMVSEMNTTKWNHWNIKKLVERVEKNRSDT